MTILESIAEKIEEKIENAREIWKRLFFSGMEKN
tara:strand:+ start:536 stop:637 length:102 start_codon:yes stop_codon:yes gene_type:complete